MRAEVKNANGEILALQNELDSCRRSVSMFRDNENADIYPGEMRSHIENIIRGCNELIQEIGSTLDKFLTPTFGQKIQWSISMRDEISRLHRSLESQKSALTMAFSAYNLSINRDIHDDTASIRGKAKHIPELREMVTAIYSVICNSGSGDMKEEFGVTMQRFFEEHDGQSLTGTTLTRSDTIKSYMTASHWNHVDNEVEHQLQESMAGRGQDDDVDATTRTTHTLCEVLGDPVPKLDTMSRDTSGQNLNKAQHPLHPGVLSRNSSLPSFSPMPQGKTEAITGKTFLKPGPPIISMRNFWGQLTSGPANSSKPTLTRMSLQVNAWNLENAATCLNTESHPITRNPVYHSVACALRSYRDADEPITSQRFAETLARHQSPTNEPPRRNARTLLGLGLISESTLNIVEEDCGRTIVKDPSTGLTYLYLVAQEIVQCETSQIQKGSWFADPRKDDELRLILHEIGNTFMLAFTDRQSFARSFYEVAASMGDRRSLVELSRCYELGIGGQIDKEAAKNLRTKAQEMLEGNA